MPRLLAILAVMAVLLSGCAGLLGQKEDMPGPVGNPLRTQWNGFMRLANLKVLPERTDRKGTGLILTQELWQQVWKKFQPKKPVPKVDFYSEFVVFARNTRFVAKITLDRAGVRGNAVRLGWTESRRRWRISWGVYAAFAVIKRQGVKSIRSRGWVFPVPPPPKRPKPKPKKKASAKKTASKTDMSKSGKRMTGKPVKGKPGAKPATVLKKQATPPAAAKKR